MIATAVLAIVAVSSALTYTVTMRAVVASKAKGIATRLAQDKFEQLSALPYTQLLVTTQSDLNTNPPGYDQTYFPPETFNMSGKTYTRGVVVSYAYRDSAGNVSILAPSAADTGLKQIKVIVTFPMGPNLQTYSSTLLVSDPGLIPLDGLAYGMITDASTGAGIAGAKVFVTQNQNWSAITSATGYYQISMDTAVYTLTAVALGYFDNQTGSFQANGPSQQNLSLTARAKGRVTGLVTARPQRLLISGVYAGAAGGQFLELYNPTTSTIVLSSGTGPQVQVKWIDPTNTVSSVTLAFNDPNRLSVRAEGFYLLATSSPTINGVTPDALFANPTSPFANAGTGGVAIENAYGVSFDSVGWGGGPSNGTQGSPVAVGGSAFGAGGVLTRSAVPAGLSLAAGNSITTSNNLADVLAYASVGAGYPRNSASTAAAQYGIPANAAGVAASDGYSASATASSTGYYLLSAVSTGTWALNGFWTSFSSRTSESVAVTANATTSKDFLLEASFNNVGGLSGNVIRSDTLAALPGIVVSAGNFTTLTDSMGNYVLNLSSGAWTISANASFSNIGYNSRSSTATVAKGGVTGGVNFNLNPAGIVTGQVTTNGTSPYPNIPVHAISQGLEVATSQTDRSGNYSLLGVPVGAATIAPIIDAQSQTSNPPSLALNVTQTTLSGNNFTVSSSNGLITGSVLSGSKPILTGALVLASTGTLPAPLLVDNSFRNGSKIIFSSISDSAGNFSLSVSKGATYTVYGYYTVNSSTTLQSVSNVFVSSNAAVTLKW